MNIQTYSKMSGTHILCRRLFPFRHNSFWISWINFHYLQSLCSVTMFTPTAPFSTIYMCASLYPVYMLYKIHIILEFGWPLRRSKSRKSINSCFWWVTLISLFSLYVYVLYTSYDMFMSNKTATEFNRLGIRFLLFHYITSLQCSVEKHITTSYNHRTP